MSTVNIIMSAYNGEKYIGEQIESIINSTYTDWSLYICDDGSSDATIEIINSYVEKYRDRIFLDRNKKNMGSTYTFLNSLKRLSEHSKGNQDEGLPYTSNNAQYFMFCDQDDIWLKDKIERTVSAIMLMEKKHGKSTPALVFTDAVVTDDKLRFITKSFYKANRLNTHKTSLNSILMENKCIGCTVVMNRALTSLVTSLPDGIRYHDWWMALLAATFGNICYLPVQTMMYRQHTGNQVGSNAFSDYVADRRSRLAEQRKVLESTRIQAEAFFNLYKDKLGEREGKLIKRFCNINDKGWYKRRYYILRYGFTKSGFVRNIGLLLVI